MKSWSFRSEPLKSGGSCHQLSLNLCQNIFCRRHDEERAELARNPFQRFQASNWGRRDSAAEAQPGPHPARGRDQREGSQTWGQYREGIFIAMTIMSSIYSPYKRVTYSSEWAATTIRNKGLGSSDSGIAFWRSPVQNKFFLYLNHGFLIFVLLRATNILMNQRSR